MDGEKMKNTYLLSYFPIIAVLLFSLSFAIYHFPPEDSLFKRVKGESPKVRGR
ncbi:hypothetical protein ACIGC1_00005 [Peribacillus butanolivorans]|uniref:hypothetical protein n=1 Tax=Peribacillus butanolivorans TaxID=421767 RepID=UPI0037CC5C5E